MAVILGSVSIARAGMEPQPIAATNVTPLVMLRDGEIASCGVSASGGRGDERIEVTIAIERAAARSDGAQYALSGMSTRGATITEISVETADGFVLSVPMRDIRDGHASGTAERSGADGALMFRNLMVSGARIELATGEGGSQALAIAGPVPHSVRQAYLNCAGDLFRPEPGPK